MKAARGARPGESAVPESYALPGSDPNAYKYDAAGEIAAYARGVHGSYRKAAAEARSSQAAVDGVPRRPERRDPRRRPQAWLTARPAYSSPRRSASTTARSRRSRARSTPGRWTRPTSTTSRATRRRHHQRHRDRDVDRRDRSRRDQASDETTSPPAGTRSSSCSGARTSPPTVRATGRPPTTSPARATTTAAAPISSSSPPCSSPISSRLADAWAPGERQLRRRFLALPRARGARPHRQRHGRPRRLRVDVERLAVGLDSGDQEDEHSCFSDTTHQDFVND